MSTQFTAGRVGEIISGSRVINQKRQELKMILGILRGFLERMEKRGTINQYSSNNGKVLLEAWDDKVCDLSMYWKEGFVESHFSFGGESEKEMRCGEVASIPAKWVCEFHSLMHFLICSVARVYPEIEETLAVLIDAAKFDEVNS